MKWAKVTVECTSYGEAYVPVPDDCVQGSVELEQMAWDAVQKVGSWGNLEWDDLTHTLERVEVVDARPHGGCYEDDFLRGLPDDAVKALAEDPNAPDCVPNDAHRELCRRGIGLPKVPRWKVTGLILYVGGKWEASEQYVVGGTEEQAARQVEAMWGRLPGVFYVSDVLARAA